MKKLEEYIIPEMGKITIYEKENKGYTSIHNGTGFDFFISQGCNTRSESRRSAEGYLRGKYPNIIKFATGDFFTAGWIKRFQTYPNKKNNKKN